jgi:hypothetical protein
MTIRGLYSHRALVALLITAALTVGVMAVLVIRQQQDQTNGQVYLEAGGTVGSNPFVPLVTPPPELSGNPGDDGTSFQQAASMNSGTTCDPEKLISHLTSDQQAGEAWVRALNYDRTLSWSGGSRIESQQIPAYIRELTPRLLVDDLRVTNYQFTNGVALPVQSVLEKGTAVLVDAKGTARVRCASGNPLTPMVQLKVPPIYRGTPWPGFQPQKVVVTQRAPQCGDGEFFDGEHCQHNAVCPSNEDHSDNGRCRGPAEMGVSSNGGPSEMQQWRDRPRRPERAWHPDELPPRDQPNYPDGPVRPDKPVTPERPQYPDKPTTPEKPQHPGMPTEPAGPKKPNKAAQPDTSRPAGKPEPPDQNDQLNKNQTPDKRKQRGDKSAQPDKPTLSDKSAQPGKPTQPTYSDKSNPSDKPARPNSSGADQTSSPGKNKPSQSEQTV